MQMSTISNTTLLLHKHVKIADTTDFLINCPPYQNTTLCYTNMSKLRTLHFCYTKSQKLRPYANVPLCQITTHFLCKHVKIASLCKCPLYQITTHFLLQIASTCKCPPYQISFTTLFLYKSAKIASITSSSVHHINHYTFPIPNHQSRAFLIF